MKTIESAYAMTALRKMAEYTPEKLLRMEKEEPDKLLKEIERRVVNALGWVDTALGKGADKSKMEDNIELLLKPDGITESLGFSNISEQELKTIHQKLISLAREE